MAGEALSGTGEPNQQQDARASEGGIFLDNEKTAGSPYAPYLVQRLRLQPSPILSDDLSFSILLALCRLPPQACLPQYQSPPL